MNNNVQFENTSTEIIDYNASLLNLMNDVLTTLEETAVQSNSLREMRKFKRQKNNHNNNINRSNNQN